MCARHTRAHAGLGHDCINPKAILQLPVQLRVRFIDLFMAFEAKLVKPLSWSHMMVLRPKPSGGHRTIGLTVAPLWVLSRLRRPLAQKWENDYDTAYFWGCQGKACDRAAWAHSIMVAAAKGRLQSAASLLLDLSKFYEHVGHDHLWEEGQKTSFPTRLLACWCASDEGWRFLEADNCATVPFWAILPGCSGATTAAKFMLATLLETVAKRLPTYRLWNVVDDISGHVVGTPKMVQVLTAEAARLLVEGLQARDLPLSRANPKSSSTARTSSSTTFCCSWRCSGSTSATRHATLGPTYSWAGGGGRSSSSGWWRGQRSERSEPGSFGRQGHTLAIRLSLARMQGCFGVPRFHSDTAPMHQSRRGQSHTSTQPRTERSHNDVGQRPGSGGRKHRPGISTLSTSHFGLGDGSLGRHSRPRHYAGCAARLSHLKRPWCGHLCAHALAAGWSAQSARHLTCHNGTKIYFFGSGAQDGGCLGGPGIPSVVRQLCTLEPVQGSALLGSHQATPCCWQAGGLVTLASERAGQAGLARHLDPGEACAAQGRGRRQLPAMQRRTRHHVPPLLRVPGLACRKKHVRLSGVAPGGTFSGNLTQGAVCSWHVS